jgi:hypothetical protein
VHASLPVQGIPDGCLSAHIPLLQNMETQSVSVAQVIPFCRMPHAPWMQSAERQTAALVQGIPSTWPHVPPAQTCAVHSWSRVQAFPLASGSSQAPLLPQMPEVHSWSRPQAAPSG